MAFSIPDKDLQALVELYVDEGHHFGRVVREMREEMGWCNCKIAIDATRHGLRLASKAGHKLCKKMLERHAG